MRRPAIAATDPLRRVDPTIESGGLPTSLLDAMEHDGGLWFASDAIAAAKDVVVAAERVRARALRLDFRDLGLLRDLPQVRYLHIWSDRRPVLDPVASLSGLRALIIETSALRGDLDPLAFPELHWLALGLGGKGGEAVLPAIERGHPHLGYLRLMETRARTLSELIGGFSRLRHVRVGFADRLRTLGDLGPVAGSLRGLDLWLADLRSLEGVEVLSHLEVLALTGGRVTDVSPLGPLDRLRYARLESASAIGSLEPLRGHPAIEMLYLSKLEKLDPSVLETLQRLRAVGRGPRFDGDLPYPDLESLPRDHRLRREWERAMSG